MRNDVSARSPCEHRIIRHIRRYRLGPSRTHWDVEESDFAEAGLRYKVAPVAVCSDSYIFRSRTLKIDGGVRRISGGTCRLGEYVGGPKRLPCGAIGGVLDCGVLDAQTDRRLERRVMIPHEHFMQFVLPVKLVLNPRIADTGRIAEPHIGQLRRVQVRRIKTGTVLAIVTVGEIHQAKTKLQGSGGLPTHQHIQRSKTVSALRIDPGIFNVVGAESVLTTGKINLASKLQLSAMEVVHAHSAIHGRYAVCSYACSRLDITLFTSCVLEHGKSFQCCAEMPAKIAFDTIQFCLVQVFTTHHLPARGSHLTGEYRGDFIAIVQVKKKKLKLMMKTLKKP